MINVKIKSSPYIQSQEKFFSYFSNLKFQFFLEISQIHYENLLKYSKIQRKFLWVLKLKYGFLGFCLFIKDHKDCHSVIAIGSATITLSLAVFNFLREFFYHFLQHHFLEF